MSRASRPYPFLLIAALCLGGCPRERQAAPPLLPPAEPFAPRIRSLEIHRVSLERPRMIDTAAGPREVREAYLVLLQMEKPKFYGPALEILVGDWKVPEYGESDGGIYFRIYDPALLRRLAGQELRYRVAKGPAGSLRTTFAVPRLEDLPLMQEREILSKRPSQE